MAFPPLFKTFKPDAEISVWADETIPFLLITMPLCFIFYPPIFL